MSSEKDRDLTPGFLIPDTFLFLYETLYSSSFAAPDSKLLDRLLSMNEIGFHILRSHARAQNGQIFIFKTWNIQIVENI